MVTDLLRWYERHPVVTGIFIAYSLAAVTYMLALFGIITLKTWGMLGEVPDIPNGTVAAYATFFAVVTTAAALLGGAQGMWRWWRERHDKG